MNTDKKAESGEKKNSGSGNYDNDIPVEGSVVNYRTNKTAQEEGKETGNKKPETDDERRKRNTRTTDHAK